MKDFYIDTSCLMDTFDLPITEDNSDYYTLPEFINEVESRIKILIKLGYKLANLKITYSFIDQTNITAGVKPIFTHRYLFIISRQAARHKNEKYFDNIIYHELCHILQLEYLFNEGLFYYTNGKLKGVLENRVLINQLYGQENSHTAFWYSFANKLNRQLLIDPPIAETLNKKDLTDILLENIYTQDFDVDIDPLMDTFGF